MIIRLWHHWLDMHKYDEAWHLNDIKDEQKEYEEARGFVDRWSELSDVVYTYTRARWTGHDGVVFPFSRFHLFAGLLYMFPKYTLRWLFFRRVAKKFGKKISAIRNPQKAHKLRGIAEEFGMDPDAFEKECKRLMKYWIFLK